MVDDSKTEIRALKIADEMTGGDDTVKSMLAEALSRAAGGQITVPARELIAGVLARSPTEPRALYLAGLAAYQDGDYAKGKKFSHRGFKKGSLGGRQDATYPSVEPEQVSHELYSKAQEVYLKKLTRETQDMISGSNTNDFRAGTNDFLGQA